MQAEDIGIIGDYDVVTADTSLPPPRSAHTPIRRCVSAAVLLAGRAERRARLRLPGI